MKIDAKDLIKTFVIGDVHGCYHTLLKLVKQLPKDARLIFVGDLCNKGNYSKDVLEFVKNNNCLCVKGNHEYFFENYTDLLDIDKRYLQCIDSYDGDKKLIKEHREWIKELPLFIQVDKYFITHGFALEFYNKRFDKDYHSDFLHNRIFPDTVEPEIKEDIVNIFGHCVFDEVQKGDKYIGIDTGCCKGGKLSAIGLGNCEIYQEPMDKRDCTVCE